MTDLTEQWKKGELPSGWYYTKLWKGCNVIDYFIGNQFLRYDDSDIVEIIAIVPSYDEWKALNGIMDSVMQTNQALCKKLSELKELLKELFETADLAYCEEDLLDKIDEVLK